MNETGNSKSEEPVAPMKGIQPLGGSGTTLSDTQKEAARCWFAEFNSRHNEILNFQQMQHSLIWVNLSVIGAIITVYFIYWQQRDFLVFLAIPIVSGLLGLYWVGQGRQTAEAGHYIHQQIRPALQTLCNDEGVMGWEEFMRRGMGTTFRRYVADIVSLRVPRVAGGLAFALPSIAAVGLTATNLKCGSWQVILIWSVGLVLTIWLMIVGWRLGKYWITAVPGQGN